MYYLANTHGLRRFTHLVSTWSAQSGPLGLAIDYMLTGSRSSDQQPVTLGAAKMPQL